MRRTIFHSFISFSILMAATGSSVYANQTACPPVELVKTTKFTNVVGDIFYSKPIMFNGLDWNVFMTSVKISEKVYDAKTTEEAIKIGQDYFDKASVDINNPIPRIDSDEIVCSYVTENNGSYVVMARSPATDVDL